jgi:pentatricopeptide repeat protein
MEETLQEAAFTFLAFLAAAGVIAAMKQRNSRNVSKRASVDKLRKYAPPVATIEKTSFAASLPRPSPAPLASSSWNHSARSGREVNFSPEGDALAAAVRHGSARNLPSLLDAAEARAKKVGADEMTLPKLNAQHLLTALRACASRRCFREALAAYDHMQGRIAEGCGNTWSLLLYSAVEQQDFSQCSEFARKLMSSMLPSGNDFVNMVRFYASSHDIEGLTHMLGELRAKAFVFETVVRNRAISACASCGALELAEVLAMKAHCPVQMDTIGYNTLMKAYASVKQVRKCFAAYASMQDEDVTPSAVTFGILLDASIEAENFDAAKNIFEDLRRSPINLNVVHYTTLLKGLVRAGHLEDATRVLEEMRGTADAKPDLVTYSTLVKAHSDQGRTIEAMRVIELMIGQNIQPDGIVLNIVLASCSVHAMEPAKVTHVFQWLRRHGLQITTATLSILVKAFVRSQAWEVALDLLDEAPSRLDFWPQARLYGQLAQACAKSGPGAVVVRCYVSMVKSAAKQGTGVDEAMNSRLHRLCASCGESAVAAAIYCAVARAGGFPEPEAIAEALKSE